MRWTPPPAMLGATATMWDVLGWGGETQALIYNPDTGKVIGINALGAAPTGATPEFFRERGMDIPPAYGPLAAVTPGTPGGLMVMMAEYGRLSLADVLAPSIDMARGYPIEAQAANSIEGPEGPPGRVAVLEGGLPPALRPGPRRPRRRRDLRAGRTSRAPSNSSSRPRPKRWPPGPPAGTPSWPPTTASTAGDIAEEFVRGSQEQGGLHTLADLADWQVYLEEPVSTSYKGIDVYKLTTWVQGPVLLQALNILEGLDVGSMGYNSTRYIHALYQAMNLAFADRDFYYGDPYFPPAEPIEGLLSKEYAAAPGGDHRLGPERPGCPARRPVPLPGRHESLPASHRRLGTPNRSPPPTTPAWTATKPSTRAPPPFRPRTPTAGSCRSPPRAAGSPRSSPAAPASA